MANEKIKYSNGCSPQELESTGVRWFQDSDVGRKLSGSANVTMSGGSLIHVSPKTITGNESALSSKDFIYIKCISGDDIRISFDNASGGYKLILSAGESFASELDSSVATVLFGPSTGSSVVEYLSGT